MKKITALLLIFICITLTACQPTPDDHFVESKNDGELQDAVYGTAVPELSDGYEAPETWVELLEGTDGITFVNIDATLTIPDVTLYPIYRVTTKDISEEEANQFIQAFAGDAQLYDVSNIRTKDVIQKEIERILYEYEDPNSLSNIGLNSGEWTQEEYDYYREQAYNKMAELEEEYKTAPTEPTLTEIERKLVQFTSPDPYSLPINTIQGAFLRDDGSAGRVHVQTEVKAPHGYNQVKHFKNDFTLTNFIVDIYEGNSVTSVDRLAMDKIHDLNDMPLSYEEAKALADEIVHKRLDYTDYALSRACASGYWPDGVDITEFYVRDKKTNADLSQMYVFYYTPTVDGIPLLYYTMDQFEGGIEYVNMTYPKCLYISMRNANDWDVYEQSSMEIMDKLNSNTPLLPFEEIQDIFRRYIFTEVDHVDHFAVARNDDFVYSDKAYYDEFNIDIERTTFNITDIRLGYVRIPEKDNIEYGLLVPVWIFYGQAVTLFGEGTDAPWQLNENNEKIFDGDPANPFLCINAIDGSIINLDKGY